MYIEMTYREPQTALIPPYVNLVNKKDSESEHNTDCDVTVVITNSYAPNICITYTSPCSLPDTSRTIRSSAGIVKKQARTTVKMADRGNKCFHDVKFRDVLVSVFRNGTERNNASNKITRAT